MRIKNNVKSIAVGCPTPPNQRRRFFLNPKVLRSSFAVQRSSRHMASSSEPIANDNPSALSGNFLSFSNRQTFFLKSIIDFRAALLSKRKFHTLVGVEYSRGNSSSGTQAFPSPSPTIYAHRDELVTRT